MYVPAINEVKAKLDQLKDDGLVREWELPYENLLSRLSAALFFLTPADESKVGEIWQALEAFENFSVRFNDEGKLSNLKYLITFSKEEKEKNEKEPEEEADKAPPDSTLQ